jgi:hypothetical protein
MWANELTVQVKCQLSVSRRKLKQKADQKDSPKKKQGTKIGKRKAIKTRMK